MVINRSVRRVPSGRNDRSRTSTEMMCSERSFGYLCQMPSATSRCWICGSVGCGGSFRKRETYEREGEQMVGLEGDHRLWRIGREMKPAEGI